MKRLIIGTSAFLLTIGMMPAEAQDGPPQFRPLEVWTCNFLDGKDQDDMDEIYEDLAGSEVAYSAFQLNPYFTGTFGANFDFVFLGAWDDGSVMGADLVTYLGTPEEAWDETVNCQGFLYASNWIQPIQPAETDATAVVTVSDCDIDHGSTPGQAIGAISRYNDYRVANGMTIGTLVWFPVYGGGDAEFDFKLVSVYRDAQHMGDSFKWSVDNAAYNVSAEMRAGLVSCDDARLYTARTIVNNIPPPD